MIGLTLWFLFFLMCTIYYCDGLIDIQDLGVARKIYSGLALMEDTEDNEGNANASNDEVQSTKSKNISPETATKASSPGKSLSLIEEEELRMIKNESADGIVAAVTSYDSA